MKKVVFLVLSLVPIAAWAAPRKVLFIGNSYTYVNDLPNLLKQLSLAMGDTIIVDSSTPGGATFQQHCTNTATLAKIAQGGWDYVVLQEQSQNPSFPPSQVAWAVYPYARTLDSLVHASSPCAETVFYMTWGRKNGDAANCGSYPVICTYEGMQARLRESYLQMAADNNATTAPVGMAWKRVRDNYPQLELYSPDESHPSLAGSYLAACVFYSSLFHKSTFACPFTTTLPDSIAQVLQQASDFTVFDSLAQWQQSGQLVVADFSAVVSGNTVNLTQQSLNATTYTWDFGDGSATSAGANTAHSYTQGGQYAVTLTAANNCHSSARTDTIIIAPFTGMTNQETAKVRVYPTLFSQLFCVQSDEAGLQLAVYAATGQLLLRQNLPQGVITVAPPRGATQQLFYQISRQGIVVKTGALHQQP